MCFCDYSVYWGLCFLKFLCQREKVFPETCGFMRQYFLLLLWETALPEIVFENCVFCIFVGECSPSFSEYDGRYMEKTSEGGESAPFLVIRY